MARNRLRDLVRRAPDSDELRSLFDLITSPDHPDASVAILAPAILEHILADAISDRFEGRLDRDALFGDRGVLGNLFNKITIAEAMGIITPATATDLNRIRHVRNAFAHTLRPLTFETPEVAAEIDALTLFGYSPDLNEGDEDPLTRKQLFGTLIFMTCISLVMTPKAWTEFRDGLVEFISKMRTIFEDFRGVKMPPAV